MHGPQEDSDSRLKLAQLWRYVSTTGRVTVKSAIHNRIVSAILENDFNINYKVTVNYDWLDNSKEYRIHLKDCTALHFTFCKIKDFDAFIALLDRGADFTIKNGNGQTVLHLMIAKIKSYTITVVRPFMTKVLCAHIEHKNSENPHDNYGVSHLHGACIVNNPQAVELFLKNEAWIEDTVNNDAPQYAGYTPLHFAVEFDSLQVVQLLLDRRANVNSKTKEGLSPLDLYLHNVLSKKCDIFDGRILQLLLYKGAISAVGFSNLQMACILHHPSEVERLLDEGAKIDYTVSTILPDKPTANALDFAITSYSYKAVKILLQRGAKVCDGGKCNPTVLDFIMTEYAPRDVLSCIKDWRAVRMTDGNTELTEIVEVMIRDPDGFELFIRNKKLDVDTTVPGDSTFWAGYSTLHLAVIFSQDLGYDLIRCRRIFETIVVKACLNHGMMVDVCDAKGQTPLHLAFIHDMHDIVALMLEHLNKLDDVENIADEDNLSYLHIACAKQDLLLVEKLLGNIADPNIVYKGEKTINGMIDTGYTPLHVAVVYKAQDIAQILLMNYADLHASDKNGNTPIHSILKFSLCPNWFDSGAAQPMVNILFDRLLENLEDHVIDGLGLSYLHVASFFGNFEIVSMLLDLGSDVNATIKCDKNATDYGRCANLTPIQMTFASVFDDDEEVANLLLRHGADLFTKPDCDITLENWKIVCYLFRISWNRPDIYKMLEERLGVTKLHVACYLKDDMAVYRVLSDQTVNVNAQMHVNAEIFAGCTPLHLLVAIEIYDKHSVTGDDPTFMVADTIKLLLDRGADVMLANGRGDTPIHLFSMNRWCFTDVVRCEELLLEANRDFAVNPANADGVTHLHLTCKWHQVMIIEKFLQHEKVNVSQHIDYFAEVNAGATPLHLILTRTAYKLTTVLSLVDLLVKKGADVSAQDVYGETAIHKPAVIGEAGMKLFNKLVSYGADISSNNIKGETPIELLMVDYLHYNDQNKKLRILQKHGYQLNSWNPLTGEGFLAKAIHAWNVDGISEMTGFNQFLESRDVLEIDFMGRTAIHNVVALSYTRDLVPTREYIYVISRFLDIGVDIDYHDKSGQTALHYAVRMRNAKGVEALLTCGADVNITDNSGKSALNYAMEQDHNSSLLALESHVTRLLNLHMMKLRYLNINLNKIDFGILFEINIEIISQNLEMFSDNYTLSSKFFRQVQLSKMQKIKAKSLTLFHFLSETGAINLYPNLGTCDREKVDEFFRSIDLNQFDELVGVIKLQLKKMALRLKMIDSGLHSMEILLGFSIPDLREQIISYLPNSDLKNLIAATAVFDCSE